MLLMPFQHGWNTYTTLQHQLLSSQCEALQLPPSLRRPPKYLRRRQQMDQLSAALIHSGGHGYMELFCGQKGGPLELCKSFQITGKTCVNAPSSPSHTGSKKRTSHLNCMLIQIRHRSFMRRDKNSHGQRQGASKSP